jgi:hypothetical protein
VNVLKVKSLAMALNVYRSISNAMVFPTATTVPMKKGAQRKVENHSFVSLPLSFIRVI